MPGHGHRHRQHHRHPEPPTRPEPEPSALVIERLEGANASHEAKPSVQLPKAKLTTLHYTTFSTPVQH